MATTSPTLSHAQSVEAAFHFYPDVGLAGMWIALYLCVTLLIWAQIVFQYKSKFMYIVVVTGFVIVLGYGLRISTALNYSLYVFIVSTFFLLIPPIALAYVNYLVAGWLLRAVGRHVRVGCCEIPAHSIARIFLASDVACFFLQASGGGLLATSDIDTINAGNAIVLTGLAIQLLFFTAYFYIILKLRFHEEYCFREVPSMHPLFRGLFLTVFFIYVRNIYRIADYASIAANSYADPGYIPSNEWVFFVFESTPIFAAFLVYAWYPFNKYMAFHEENPKWRQELAEAKSALEKKSQLQQTSEEGAFLRV